MKLEKLMISIRFVLTAIAAATLFLPALAAAADTDAGKAAFELNCVSCHGATGKGDGPVGKVLQPPPRDFSVGEFKFDTDGDGTPGQDADLKGVILQGAAAFGGSPLMAPWPSLSEDDVANVIAYIRSLKE